MFILKALNKLTVLLILIAVHGWAIWQFLGNFQTTTTPIVITPHKQEKVFNVHLIHPVKTVTVNQTSTSSSIPTTPTVLSAVSTAIEQPQPLSDPSLLSTIQPISAIHVTKPLVTSPKSSVSVKEKSIVNADRTVSTQKPVVKTPIKSVQKLATNPVKQAVTTTEHSKTDSSKAAKLMNTVDKVTTENHPAVNSSPVMPTGLSLWAKYKTDALPESDSDSSYVTADYQAESLHNPKPIYPPLSRKNNEQGTVLVHVLVNTSGYAEKAEIKQSSYFNRLDQAAYEAVMRWRYIPAKRAGKNIEEWITIPIKWELR
ncbi:TonB family protein [Beggiatoa alba B18LD]|uniref:TonB family protein n=1 Tax=Beggiatoa alba B18LD TaxID=395493 RepID=I3CDD2_9GAMM|nr:energy transducer TonB [Beggiatoa alba]EIJ41625.1 TonB family protein [Beggiatoa alba B18LD]